MPYLTTQYPIHKNLLRVFFSNATLENADEHDEDPCCIVSINTFVIGVPIQLTRRVVAETFATLDNDLGDEHVGFPISMVMPNDNALDLPFHERVLHLFIFHFFRPIRSKHTIVWHTDY